MNMSKNLFSFIIICCLSAVFYSLNIFSSIEPKKGKDGKITVPPYPNAVESNPGGTNLPVRKPIILFYNYDDKQNVEVKLELRKNLLIFKNCYPENENINRSRNQAMWEIKLLINKNYTNNIFQFQKTKNQKLYSYIFWEALGHKKHFSEYLRNLKQEFYYFSKEKVLNKLDDMLTNKGLNVAERQDFITYWLRPLLRYDHVRIAFLNIDILDKIAKLSISPSPDTKIRVFMLIRPLKKIKKTLKYQVNSDKLFEIEKREKENPLKRENIKGKLVVEWGGMFF